MDPSSTYLDIGKQDWWWKQRDASIIDVRDESNQGNAPEADFRASWKKTTSFPSEVHVELLKLGAIPDPYVGFNEHAVQWIGDVEWLYKCDFTVDSAFAGKFAKLVFEGLDTICDIYLDQEKILSTDNMFRTYIHQLLPFSSARSTHTLLLHFKSAKALAKAEEAKYGKVRAGSTNLGDPSRVYVRKAQYDWRVFTKGQGPELMTCGPYRPITLVTYTSRILDFHTRTAVDIKSDGTFTAALKVDINLEGTQIPGSALVITLEDSKRQVIKLERVEVNGWDSGESHSNFVQKSAVEWSNLQNDTIDLWWPVGYGKPNLYNIKVVLVTPNDAVIDERCQRFGFRTAQLIQEPLLEPDQYGTGTTFLFEINGVRMFMGGSNWVPADNFLTQISDDRYHRWLTLLRDGNQNMVRLWGGGVYEPDIFYDICDELGLLVWQDFQFACGVYPAHDAFVASVKQEAIDNVTRLRRHPSIVCFCGNNEDYQMVLQWGGIGELPARILYEHVFPEIVSELTDPPVPYHRGSPYGGKGWDTADPTIGDVHQWNVWGGKELQYQEYDKLGGRFVSEFGIPGMPSMQTINYWMQGADKYQFYSQSQLMAQHTKAGSFERRFAIVMNENFRLTSDFETHVYTTQLMQSEAVSFAYRSWRREWRGRGREYTAGVLVWQSNDCWPVVSWAIADYFLRPKPVYYTIARQLAPITVGIFRNVVKNRDNDRPRQFYEFGAMQTLYATLSVWGTNNTLKARPAKLELCFFDLRSPDECLVETRTVVLQPNQTTELLEMKCPGPAHRKSLSPGDPLGVSSANVVASARLLDVESGEVLARYSDWPEPYRFLQPPDPGLLVEVKSVFDDETTLALSVKSPAKCVVLSVDGDVEPVVHWSDNALDLVPDDPQIVFARGLKGRRVKVAYFGREKAHDIQSRSLQI
ncbi:Beta-mannosidase B [Psilocybe cubensis]|uniref:Beta-mannosidase B n=1 Tax=Psilocybe cubensis TaxID=181762 RepID=A0ACB8GXV8_PSICU|nr:Beta-mannosidase B [Psilocybe cubensis]KAH9480071.1 Beta-mannosidase B [Psilocybe cubensis]